MNFFKSVFADDDDDNDPQSPPSNHQQQQPQIESPNETLNQNQIETPTWGFVGGLIKTFQSKSESVIETYRRDLEEFSTGLKKETLVFKEVASSSLEVGASKAQESLESVGQAFDSIGSVVWNSTSQIIAQTKDFDLDNPNPNPNSDLNLGNLSLNSNSPLGRYSRFDAQLRGIQSDVNSYVEEIEDLGDFERWKLGFDLGGKSGEMGDLMKENGVMEGIYKRVVPNLVDHEVFWLRYFYRVHKLEQAESVRAKLVERANADEEEELSWDVDDEEEEEKDEHGHEEERAKEVLKKEQKDDNVGEKKSDGVEGEGDLVPQRKDGDVEEEKSDVKDEGDGKVLMSESSEVVKAKEEKVEGNEEVEEKKKGNGDEKAPSEGSKDSDISIVSSQPYREEEEDLGWDEIEDLGSDDEVDKKGKSVGSPSNREELRKRLSVAEDDEDLSWDIEDDDEPIKKN